MCLLKSNTHQKPHQTPRQYAMQRLDLQRAMRAIKTRSMRLSPGLLPLSPVQSRTVKKVMKNSSVRLHSPKPKPKTAQPSLKPPELKIPGKYVDWI